MLDERSLNGFNSIQYFQEQRKRSIDVEKGKRMKMGSR